MTADDDYEPTPETLADVDLKLDLTNYRILYILYDEPLWKNEIHERLQRHEAETVSVQTVGRRVDQLQDAGLVNAKMVSPESIQRDLIIAFETTDLGVAALQEAHVCTQGECRLLAGPDEAPHVHDFTRADRFIADHLDPDPDATPITADTTTDTDAAGEAGADGAASDTEAGAEAEAADAGA